MNWYKKICIILLLATSGTTCPITKIEHNHTFIMPRKTVYNTLFLSMGIVSIYGLAKSIQKVFLHKRESEETLMPALLVATSSAVCLLSVFFVLHRAPLWAQ